MREHQPESGVLEIPTQKVGFGAHGFEPKWRATVDENRQDVFAIPL